LHHQKREGARERERERKKRVREGERESERKRVKVRYIKCEIGMEIMCVRERVVEEKEELRCH